VTVGSLKIGAGAGGSGNVVIGPGSHLTLTSTTINVGAVGSGVLDIQAHAEPVNGTTLSPGTFGRIVQLAVDRPGGGVRRVRRQFGGDGTARPRARSPTQRGVHHRRAETFSVVRSSFDTLRSGCRSARNRSHTEICVTTERPAEISSTAGDGRRCDRETSSKAMRSRGGPAS